MVKKWRIVHKYIPLWGYHGMLIYFKMADVNKAVSSKRKTKDPKIFTDEETETLINLWSKEPVLYQCKHKDYFKKELRTSAFERVLQGLDKTEITSDELQRKMACLRTYYGKELGKERSSKLSGTGTNDVYTSKWPFFESLLFLRDNITPRKTSSNIEEPVTIADELEEAATSVSGINDADRDDREDSQQLCVFKVNRGKSQFFTR